MVERRLLRRVAAILYHRRAGFSANGMGVWRVPEDQVLEVGQADGGGPRASPTATSAPPTRTGPTRSSRWRTGARSQECDAILDRIADEHDLHDADRAVLYSSTEFKKVRLHYFTDDYARWEGASSHAGGPIG